MLKGDKKSQTNSLTFFSKFLIPLFRSVFQYLHLLIFAIIHFYRQTNKKFHVIIYLSQERNRISSSGLFLLCIIIRREKRWREDESLKFEVRNCVFCDQCDGKREKKKMMMVSPIQTQPKLLLLSLILVQFLFLKHNFSNFPPFLPFLFFPTFPPSLRNFLLSSSYST